MNTLQIDAPVTRHVGGHVPLRRGLRRGPGGRGLHLPGQPGKGAQAGLQTLARSLEGEVLAPCVSANNLFSAPCPAYLQLAVNRTSIGRGEFCLITGNPWFYHERPVYEKAAQDPGPASAGVHAGEGGFGVLSLMLSSGSCDTLLHHRLKLARLRPGLRLRRLAPPGVGLVCDPALMSVSFGTTCAQEVPP